TTLQIILQVPRRPLIIRHFPTILAARQAPLSSKQHTESLESCRCNWTYSHRAPPRPIAVARAFTYQRSIDREIQPQTQHRPQSQEQQIAKPALVQLRRSRLIAGSRASASELLQPGNPRKRGRIV